MDKYVIKGGNSLVGEVEIGGAKISMKNEHKNFFVSYAGSRITDENKAELLFDGVHPNNDGYREIGSFWTDVILSTSAAVRRMSRQQQQLQQRRLQQQLRSRELQASRFRISCDSAAICSAIRVRLMISASGQGRMMWTVTVCSIRSTLCL